MRAVLPAALTRREAYPRSPRRVSVRETHISWVFLAGDRAYKLKKPVVLDFVDYGSPQRRHEMCAEEVRLNRRLAPDLYLGVRAVIPTQQGVQIAAEDDPAAIDYVVEMARYDERDTLASWLGRGELEGAHVEAIGRRLASFHEQAPAVHDLGPLAPATQRRFDRNVQELLGGVERLGESGRVLALERFAHAFIAGHARLLQERMAAGRVREGHGDLRAEHVLVGEEVRVVDCVEFDRGLRTLDVADDLAFLVFDLVAHGAERFAKILVGSYRQAGGDPGPDSLLAFHATYWALVRAKVALLRAGQLPSASSRHGHESARARELIALAERFAWRARSPLVVVVCGLPASGKSELARALAELSGLPHLNSDVTRKQLAGLAATQRAGTERYDETWNARTYAELGRRVAREVAEHGGALVDATFRHRADREAFRTAFAAAAPVLFVECQAPAEVLARRALDREQSAERVSDADLAVTLRELERWEPLEEISAEAHLALRTDRSLKPIVDDLLALLDRRLLDGLGWSTWQATHRC